MKLSSLTTEYVCIAVTPTIEGDTLDPTSDAVKMAFVTTGELPETDDFQTGSWETIDGIAYAKCLVGPTGGLALAAGQYDVWIKITDSPEIPVRKVGTLNIG